MPEFRLRDGNANDIDRITDITLSALKGAKDDLFLYNFPHCDEYPQDNRYYWRLRLEPAAYEGNTKFLVVEMVRSQGDGKVVAWSNWNWNSGARDSAPRSFPKDTIGKAIASKQTDASATKRSFIFCILGMYTSMRTSIIRYFYPRRDADLAHYQAFLTAANEADEKYWKGLYPENLYLSGFYTDPEYQGQGAGHSMMHWGLQTAAAKQCVIGLNASNSRAAEVYRHWGFEDIGIIKVQRQGEEAHVDMPVLLYKPNGED